MKGKKVKAMKQAFRDMGISISCFYKKQKQLKNLEQFNNIIYLH